MKFYNRKQEIKEIRTAVKLAKNSSSKLITVIGRRRIGKSELIKQVLTKKKHLYFFVSKKSSQLLLNEFTQIYNIQFNKNIAFENWDSFFYTLFTDCVKTKTIIVFDEFQNFKQLSKHDIFGTIQKHFDNMNNKGLVIITAGSLVNLLENIFYSSKEALYGRATNKQVIQEFTFKTVYEILTDYYNKKPTINNLLTFYSVFGGVP